MGSKNTNNYSPNLLRHKPLFGLDIGHGSLKVMQLDEASLSHGKPPRVIGYGTTTFDSTAFKDNVIVKPELIAEALLGLFKNSLIGDITTRRVAMAIPSYRAFSRSMQLPKLSPKELSEAVRMQAEEYTPMPLEELYLDYTVTGRSDETTDLFAVAVPKNVVDSYILLTKLTGLEAMVIETTMDAASRLFAHDNAAGDTSVIIDFGSLTADISIFRDSILVTGTVPAGGLVFTKAIKDTLKVTDAEAGVIKTKYGLGVSKKQAEITRALEPSLQKLIKEIRRMMRYHEERYGAEHPISQIIMLGGGANMPGMSDYLTNSLRLPVRSYDPWQHLEYKGLQTPADPDKSMYATVAGLSLINPKTVYAS